MKCDTISVVIPSFNEERYLPATLRAVARSAALLELRHGVRTELIVVDNGSTDGTATVARTFGASVVAESEHNIARARNRGAETAAGEILVFLDADTLVPDELLPRIRQVTATRGCLGGSVDI
jgi:glycosyltransferase involved in cell wall biosynthesis